MWTALFVYEKNLMPSRMEATGSFETSVLFYHIVQPHITHHISLNTVQAPDIEY